MTTRFNLVRDPWILSTGGRRVTIAELLQSREFESVRPDFRAAVTQLIIGLLQTAFAPRDRSTWFRLYDAAPDTDRIQSAFDAVADAFNLDDDEHPFMQDAGVEQSSKTNRPIGDLLIDKNEEHFVRSRLIEGLCDPCAAQALFTLQLNAPSGGRGHRTSLRGGGPLTTLLMPDAEAESKNHLWKLFWRNVFDLAAESSLPGGPQRSGSAVFPWLGAMPSDPAAVVHPSDVSRLQVYWAMPRRILLDSDRRSDGTCGICGDTAALITSFWTEAYGFNYSEHWRHPLSPYYGSGTDLLPVHAHPGGPGYRDWLGFVIESQDKSRDPAFILKHDQGRSNTLNGEPCRLWTFGYDVDNAKARCWYDSTMPILNCDRELAEELRDDLISRMIDAAQWANQSLRNALKTAWFGLPRPSDSSRKDLSFITDEFYAATQDRFFETVGRAQRILMTGGVLAHSERTLWREHLDLIAKAHFDRWVPVDDYSIQDRVKQIVRARSQLLGKLRGPQMRKLLAIKKEAA